MYSEPEHLAKWDGKNFGTFQLLSALENDIDGRQHLLHLLSKTIPSRHDAHVPSGHGLYGADVCIWISQLMLIQLLLGDNDMLIA